MVGVLFGAVAGGAVLWWVSIKPSNTRKWSPDQILLPEADVEGDVVHVRNIRNFTYRTEDDYTPGYYERSFRVSDLKRVYFVFTIFKKSKLGAHGFFSFDFGDGGVVSISVEIRKQHTQKYSALKGLLKQYELMYVVADERDVVSLRTHCRGNDVFMYPLTLTKQEGQALFLDMMWRVNKLVHEPEFYNTVRNACVMNLAQHLNAVSPGKVPFDVRLVVSGYADRYLHQLGLLDTPLPYWEAREMHYVSERARTREVTDDFSQWLRQFVSLEGGGL